MENELSLTKSHPNDENFLKFANKKKFGIIANIRYDNLQRKLYSDRKIDLRVRIKEIFKFPYSAIGALFIKYQGDFWLGTGCLISENLVLTAAHNIFIKNEFEGSEIQFYPGLNDDQTVIDTNKSKIRKIFIPDEYIEDSDSTEDYALIVLEEPLGKYFGCFGISVFNKNLEIDSIDNSLDYYLHGYPGDKIRNKPGNYELWGMKLGNVNLGNDGYIRYQVDSYSGMSGGCVWYADKSKNDQFKYFLIGIHVMHNYKTREGKAVLINKKRFEKICEWINML